MRRKNTTTPVIVNLLTLVGLLSLSSLAMAEDPVYFADVNLKAAVESTLGISDPTPTDMLSLTVLDARFSGIVDLTGLEYATNLTDMNLSGNQISDISALSGLTNLTGLYLSTNQISDISVLSGLTNLTGLYLGGNQISDISALSALTNLTHLRLQGNQISDISALSGLTNLTGLYLSSNPLNLEAYCTYIPLIQVNNPGIYLSYDPNPHGPCAGVCTDNDGDGYGVCPDCGTDNGCAYDGNDCNDSDLSVNPGATELCDGKDNDCDGQMDEGNVCAPCVCDLNYDGICDEADLIIFGNSHGWGYWDCNEPGVECLCDLVKDDQGTCNDLDGAAFSEAYSMPECRLGDEQVVYTLIPDSIPASQPGSPQKVKIKGLNFGATQGSSTLHIGGKTWSAGHPKIKIWENSKIKFKVPAYSGSFPKYKDVWVTVNGIDSNKVQLEITAP